MFEIYRRLGAEREAELLAVARRANLPGGRPLQLGIDVGIRQLARHLTDRLTRGLAGRALFRR